MAPDVRKYAEQLTVTPPAIRSYPPNGVTLVNLPTYFAADAQGSGRQTVGGQGYSLRLQVAASQYDWSFGDGAATTTADGGGPPPDGDVVHTYPSQGSVRVGVSVEYGATYTVVTPYGSFGPEQVTGGAVRTVPAAMDLQVNTAQAGLTG